MKLGPFKNLCQSGKEIGGADEALSSLIKQLTEAALAAEIDSHLSQDLNRNRKNGYTTKIMKSDHGKFEPQIFKKNQTTMTDEIEKKMPSLYALGNSYSLS